MKAKLYNRILTEDGICLSTNVYFPSGPGPYPIILHRTPYDTRSYLNDARWFTEKGYAYIVQDCRGRYESGGEFRHQIYEEIDGRVTFEWAAGQSWCNGRIGLRGKSYDATVQPKIAAGGYDSLCCMVPNATHALEKGAPTKLTFTMQQTAYTFPKGSRPAVLITSSSYSHILPNHNTMAPTFAMRPGEPARNSVLCGSNNMTTIILPVVDLR